MSDLKYYSTAPPPDAVGLDFEDGDPILYTHDCVLLERMTYTDYVYVAVNYKTKKRFTLCRRKTAIGKADLDNLAMLIRNSSIAGRGEFEADRPVREHLTLKQAQAILTFVFNKVMPRYGFHVRLEQLDLASEMLSAIARHGALLTEAETGTGKTLAYLIAAIIAKRGRLNDFHNMSLYPDMQYAAMSKMPIVLATSSIALQKAILTEYIPQLSDMLLTSGVIREPITAVLRKGHGHYLCTRKLDTYLANISNRTERQQIKALLQEDTFDLAELEGLPLKVRDRISVEGQCYDTCPHRESCRYLEFREETQSPAIDIQVCNHNYLLADTLHRAEGKQPLIPNYQMLIIDEAHKFIEAAQTMYGAELPVSAVPEICRGLTELTFRRRGVQTPVITAAKKLMSENTRLFKDFTAVDAEAARHLRNIGSIAGRLIPLLEGEAYFAKTEEILSWVSGKYGADTSVIDLDAAMEKPADLLNAICNLKEVKKRLSTEAAVKRKSFSYNTERQFLHNTNSKIRNAICRQVRVLKRQYSPYGRRSELLIRLIRELSELRSQAEALSKHQELITWLEDDCLRAIPKNTGERLFADQWSKRIPTILTSGTLSAAGDFARTKHVLGLDKHCFLAEVSKSSPFNYRENALLYISNSTLFPDQQSDTYLSSIAAEIERLVIASHGHAAVLFTSYKVMNMVWEQLSKRNLPYPMFRLDKGGVREIERFKQSGNGILVAAGALWEGIDIPGDALSLLVIVKLPFPMPNAIGEYERTLYPSFYDYRDSVIVPEMLIKLKQGFGRLIRTETDTGAVAILDSRAGSHGAYRERVLNALPNCRTTSDMRDIADFIREKKSADYFSYSHGGNSFKEADK